MPLFVVQHKHAAETCPAGHPEMGPMLLKHIAHENAARTGVNILSDAVVD
ncbi:MAG: sulfite oxidase, partial [Chloroflexi bacterium]|nr:sulfite oxidase [Chloroflexota bacterium]